MRPVGLAGAKTAEELAEDIAQILKAETESTEAALASVLEGCVTEVVVLRPLFRIPSTE